MFSFYQERRILITHWAGNAYEKLLSSKYDALRLSIWRKTGCLLTVDGSEDLLVEPEQLPNYKVPAPCPYVLPSEEAGAGNRGVEGADNEEDQQIQIEGEEQPPPEDTSIPERIDRKEDQEINDFCGRKIKALYANVWVQGTIMYYNNVLGEYYVKISRQYCQGF